MTPLARLLFERIAQDGPLPFSGFMATALYQPEHGYYTARGTALGRGGDYFTNVSVGPLFGRLLMRQFAEMWRRLEQPPRFTIVEQGAHRGDFAHDVLGGARALEPAFFAAACYVIVEPLAGQTGAQRARLAEFEAKVDWVPTLEELSPWTGVHFSNELIDAFPVHIVRWSKGEWRERRVGQDEGRLVWVDAPLAGEALSAQVARLPRDLPDGYTTEVNLQAGPWLTEVSAGLERGWVLAIDYGYPRAEYYRRERVSGTLSAYSQHRRVDDPLSRPGEIDLTAHVDFTTLAEASGAAGLQLAGFADQHHLMAGLARLHFRDADELTPELEKENRAFKTLMHPNFMGSSFKAICLASGGVSDERLSGFAFAGNGADRL